MIAPSLARAETVVATVAGDPISMAELEKTVKPQLIEIENNRYDVLEQGLEGMISEKLLAKEAAARGVTVEQLRSTEIEAKIQQPTDDDARQLFEQNKAQLGNAAFDDLKPRIVAYLVNQRSAARQTEFLDELKKKYETKISLEPPKIDVDTAGRASRGGDASAPVTIIAFSDYECPFCKRAENTVAQVMSTYGNQVRYVHRDFPLPFHAHAHEAAQAARCVGDQGKFWEYHDKVFQAQDLSRDNLKKLATEVGADPQKLDQCISSGTHEDEIQADIAAGSDVGVSGTPAFFINGRMLSGAQPFERFKEIIDGEIARRQAAAAAK
jgi:protein-disulfide isomerase